MTDGAKRVRKHREKMKAAGLKPVTIWVPDVNAPGYREQLARDIAIINAERRQHARHGTDAFSRRLERLEMKQGDIIAVSLPGDYGKPRPAVVVQSDDFAHLHSVTVLPLTSNVLSLEQMSRGDQADRAKWSSRAFSGDG